MDIATSPGYRARMPQPFLAGARDCLHLQLLLACLIFSRLTQECRPTNRDVPSMNFEGAVFRGLLSSHALFTNGRSR